MGATANAHLRRYNLNAQHDQHIKVKVTQCYGLFNCGSNLDFSSNVAYVWDVGNCTSYMDNIVARVGNVGEKAWEQVS